MASFSMGTELSYETGIEGAFVQKQGYRLPKRFKEYLTEKKQ
jgi:hypothetical protein